jgi:preprotein translocase subunit YajC
MILSITLAILPLLCIALLGGLLLIKPQQEALHMARLARQSLRPGTFIKTTIGQEGMVVASTKTHVLIVSSDGQKHEFLKQLVVPHEARV